MIVSTSMLLAHNLGNFGLAGTASVQQLQQALVNLAIATNRPAINPGVVTGEVNDQTVLAVSSALSIIAEELPNSLYLILQAGLIVGSTTTTAKKKIEEYAPQLTIAANAAALKLRQAPPAPPIVAPVPSGFFAPGWYKTPIGIGLIGLGLFIGYKLFFAPRPASA